MQRYINKHEKVEQVTGSKGLDEMTKQVMHLEKSLYQITKSNEKNVLRKNDEIFKRIKENTELVTNLNDIKKENKEILLKIRSKKEEIDRLRTLKNGQLADCKNVDNSTYKQLLQDDYPDERRLQQSRTSLLRQSASRLQLGVGPKEMAQESKKTFQKIEVELVSELEFVGEKTQKMEFYIRDMKDKIKKHLVQFQCSPECFVREVELEGQQ